MKKRIAVVEDDYILALVMTRHFTNLGFLCNSFPSADDFFAFEKEHPDLHAVILDIKIKGEMNGIELFHALEKKSKVPVIFSTGNSDLEELRTLNSSQVRGILIKPINLDELSALINQLEN